MIFWIVGAMAGTQAEVATKKIDPVPGDGAIKFRDHVFFERKGNGPKRRAGRLRFVPFRPLTSDGWPLSRLFNYAHQAAL